MGIGYWGLGNPQSPIPNPQIYNRTIILFLNYNFILCHNHNNLNVNLITNYNNHYLCHILFKFNI